MCLFCFVQKEPFKLLGQSAWARYGHLETDQFEGPPAEQHQAELDAEYKTGSPTENCEAAPRPSC